MSKQARAKPSMALGFVVILALFGGGLTVVLMHGEDAEQGLYSYASVHVVRKDPTVFATVQGKMIPVIDLNKMLAATPTVLAQGKKLYKANCFACHGEKGDGMGPAGRYLVPRPRNFTKKTGWVKGYTIASIYGVLSTGLKGTSMASFDTLPPKDRFALAHYVQSFGKFDHHDDAAKEIVVLKEKYGLGRRVRGPGKVAVPTIMDHMASEYRAAAALSAPAATDQSSGAQLWRRLVADPVRAAEVLERVPDWRTNLDRFAKALVWGSPRNGFRSEISLLDSTQWARFHKELVSLGTDSRPANVDDPR